MSGIDLPSNKESELKYFIDIAIWPIEGATFRKDNNNSLSSMELAAKHLDSLEKKGLIKTVIDTIDQRGCVTTSKGEELYNQILSLYK